MEDAIKDFRPSDANDHESDVNSFVDFMQDEVPAYNNL